MPSVLERLRAALAPGIAVEGELARGGMGVVLLGRDTVLDRPVAIKTLAPERTTAVLAERFVREARSMAGVSHPNVVVVHDAGVADGLPYYVMDFCAGGTLKTRLARGRLSPRQVVSLGRDLLAALAATHRKGIIHRDVKPGNIFLDGGRALLADFGVSHVSDPDKTALTDAGVPIGTPGYMAPEQLQEVKLTPAADLYAAGLVLLEAATGERWDQQGPVESAKLWPRVPEHLREPLRRALDRDPGKRWTDAHDFAAALTEADRRAARAGSARLVRRATAVLAVGLAGVLVYRVLADKPRRETSVTVFPFDPVALADSGLAAELSGISGFYIERMPRIVVTHFPAAARAWHSSELPPGERLSRLTSSRLRTAYGLWGTVRREGASLRAELQVVDSTGTRITDMTVRGDTAHRWAFGDSIGAEFVRTVLGHRPDFPKVPAEVSPAAWPMFFEGELAFARGSWLQAERQYAAALAADSAFLLAAWRLANVRRWLVIDPAYPPGFAELYQARGDALLQSDRRLIEAQLAPTAEERFRRYDEAIGAAGGDAYAALFYGDELFHRGPLAGRPLRDAVTMLRRALAADSAFAPAWEHLTWALIRLGDRAGAEDALRHLARVTGPREEYRLYLPPLLNVAYAMRFGDGDPARAGSLLQSPDALALAARGALAFDIPRAELLLGSALGAMPGPPMLRASGRTAEGLALVALGRPVQAGAQFDAAAAAFPGGPVARLNAAQWRVIPPALGMPGFGARQVADGRRALASLAADTVLGHRAAWALAVDAYARGDTAGGHRWAGPVRRSADSAALVPLLEALELATDGRLDQAVLVVAPAAAFDSAGIAPDPFLRSAVHLARGEWLRRLGKTAEAERDWLWHENTDTRGWPDAELQPAEVDWALSTWARWRRAELARVSGDRTSACALAARVAEIWNDTEPAVDSVARLARRMAADCRG